MNQGWLLVHRTGHTNEMGTLSQGFLWSTCLRQIAILPEGDQADFALSTDYVYRGEAAYKFLLEVICGLHSPLAGETEVLGQFKDFCNSVKWEEQTDMRFFKEVALQLFIDSKKVRTQFLKGLGSQSYGSLARRWLSGEEQIHVLGGGRLVQDILPWLTKAHVKVQIYVRNPEKVKSAEWFKAYKEKVLVLDYRLDQPVSGGVIVCAPMSAAEIQTWMGDANISRILDLRGESELDPILSSALVQGLQQAFKKIESNKDRVLEQSRKAFEEIQTLAAASIQSQKNRPFGWDDLCA